MKAQSSRHLFREDPATYLTDPELLAQLLNISQRRAHKALSDHSITTLAAMSQQELINTLGVTSRQALTLVTANAYAIRLNSGPEAVPEFINHPSQAAEILIPLAANQTKEELHVLNLSSRNQVISHKMLYRGNINSTMVRPAEILRPAILANAHSIILSHNHPSGDCTPSPEDIKVTQDIAEAANLMGMKLLDHIIIARPKKWTSIKQMGHLPDEEPKQDHHYDPGGH